MKLTLFIFQAILIGGITQAQNSSKIVLITDSERNLYECTTEGITGSTLPIGVNYGSIIDNTTVWTYIATLPNTYKTTITNNVIAIGNGLVGDVALYGIAQEGAITNDISNNYHNSIYIGGIASGTINNTSAYFQHADFSSPVIDLRNNILANNRKNGSHLALLSDAYSNLSTCDYNVYQFNGNFAAVGTTLSYSLDFASWQINSSKDAHSYTSDPMFIDPANSTTPNLQITSSAYTDVDGKGSDLLSIVPDDYNGMNRSLYSPNDIGAYITSTYTNVQEHNTGSLNYIVYTNPSDQINVHYGGELSMNAEATVYNTVGQKLYSQRLVNIDTTLDTKFHSGIYVVVVKSGSNSTARKIIVN